MKKIEDIAKSISKLNEREINLLSEVLLNYDISSTIYRFGVVPMIEYGDNNDIGELFLVDAGHSKLGCVKLVKEVAGLGLREAKDVVDSIPCMFVDCVTREQYLKVQELFDEYGAKVELR